MDILDIWPGSVECLTPLKCQARLCDTKTPWSGAFLISNGFTTQGFVVYLLHTINFIAGKVHFLEVNVARENADVTQLTTLEKAKGKRF